MAYIKEFGLKQFILENLRKVVKKTSGNFMLLRHFIEYVDKQIIRVLEIEMSDVIGEFEKELTKASESKQCICAFWEQGENNLLNINRCRLEETKINAD